MGAVLALLSSALWGTSDYCGGVLARRYRVAAVLVLSQGLGLACLLVFLALGSGFGGTERSVLWGAAGGVVGPVALASFYRGMSTGLFGVVAPIAGTGAVVPVLVGVAQGERPGPAAVVGIAVALAGVALAALPPRGVPRTVALEPVLLALVAAAGFGAVFVCLAKGSSDGVGITLLAQRSVSVALVSVAGLAAGSLVLPRDVSDWSLFAASGVFDLAANGAFAVASRDGLVSVTSVLASLYPVVTVVLAWKLLGERLAPLQRAGVALALAGVVLLALG